ncbi:putative aspergillopepsin protein [Thozetella sp. PMI_491]|nr:putative aspergillopepsin protein [Thozetella sp. PMI_491]
MRPVFLALAAGALLASPAAAEFSYTATVVQDGQEISSDDAPINFVPAPPEMHLPFRNATVVPTVKGKRATTVYGTNWCGAVQPVASGDTYSSNFAYFTVPDLSLRPSISTPQYASTSVGIDGATCQNAFVQAGASTQISSTGNQTVSIWFEWYPDANYVIAGFPANPGDWLSVQITMSSSLNVALVISNVAKSYSVKISLVGATALCRSDAVWVLSDTSDGVSSQLPFASFADVWFEEVQATTTKGSSVGATGATLYSLVDSAFQVKCEAGEYDNSNFYVYSTN